MEITPLCELAYKYGSDKCPKLGHGYTPIYYELLKGKPIKKVLELGIGSRETMQWNPEHYQTGASLRMWRDFFPEAQVYGVDWHPSCMFSDERIKTFQLNTLKANHMKKLIDEIGSDIDLVIDDGIHRTTGQLKTMKNILPLLDNPIYIVEDCKSPELLCQNVGGYKCEIIKRKPNSQDNLVLIG